MRGEPSRRSRDSENPHLYPTSMAGSDDGGLMITLAIGAVVSFGGAILWVIIRAFRDAAAIERKGVELNLDMGGGKKVVISSKDSTTEAQSKLLRELMARSEK